MIEKIVSRASSSWTNDDGPQNNIVISSRIRLARNLNKVLMPGIQNESSSFSVLEQVRNAFEDLQLSTKDCHFYRMSEIPVLERQILVEKHLISPEFIAAKPNQGLMISSDESVSIMVNEEDHLRLQVIYNGLQLEQAWDKADAIDNLLESKLEFAYDEKWGYLTACPTNVGTGLRASVMVHLPALVITKQANRYFATLNQLGLAVRGLYGEGSEATGRFFQISNQVTLGQKESEIVQSLVNVTLQIAGEEEKLRKLLMKQNFLQLSDRAGRALGTLKYATILGYKEALNLLSDVRLGQDIGILSTGLGNKELTELLIQAQPAFLQKNAGKNMDTLETDIARAKLFKEILN